MDARVPPEGGGDAPRRSQHARDDLRISSRRGETQQCFFNNVR
jgi:hypothetical protein